MSTRNAKMAPLMVRVGPSVREKLEILAQSTGKSRAAIIRALIFRASVTGLPQAWTALSEDEKAFLDEVER
jgi:predicted transcriptional regulator